MSTRTLKSLMLVAQKGGVGKTAIATMLAHYLALLRGKRVLVINLDHQKNLVRPLSQSGKVTMASITSDKLLTDPKADVEVAPYVLVPGDKDALESLERQPDKHNAFAGNFRSFLRRMEGKFDVVIVDTNPNPDIRVLAAMVSIDYVLAPIQLNQESIDGIADLFNGKRVGIGRIRATLNKELKFLGMLPNLVKPVPFQRINLEKLLAVPEYRAQLMGMKDNPTVIKDLARIPDRTVIAQIQASGQVLWEVKNHTAAREAWAEIKPVMDRIAQLMGVE